MNFPFPNGEPPWTAQGSACAFVQTKPAGVNEIFLTFDDGPNEPYTSQILDVLKEHQARATFFVCGKGVERFPLITRRILDEGHSLGNHTYSHSMLRTITGLLGKRNRKNLRANPEDDRRKNAPFPSTLGGCHPLVKKIP